MWTIEPYVRAKHVSITDASGRVARVRRDAAQLVRTAPLLAAVTEAALVQARRRGDEGAEAAFAAALRAAGRPVPDGGTVTPAYLPFAETVVYEDRRIREEGVVRAVRYGGRLFYRLRERNKVCQLLGMPPLFDGFFWSLEHPPDGQSGSFLADLLVAASRKEAILLADGLQVVFPVDPSVVRFDGEFIGLP